MTRHILLTASLLALVVCLSQAWANDEPEGDWRTRTAYKKVQVQELKQLRSLMNKAVAKKYRRQAWALARWILELDPTSKVARKVSRRWQGQELRAGRDPKPGWAKERKRSLDRIGTAYAELYRDFRAEGHGAESLQPLLVRALTYGNRSDEVVAALDGLERTWMGDFGLAPRQAVVAFLGDLHGSLTFPSRFDEACLQIRARWPEGRILSWADWRLCTDLGYEPVLGALPRLEAAETWFARSFEPHPPPRDESQVVHLLLFANDQSYARVAPAFTRDDWVARHPEGGIRTRGGGPPRLLVPWNIEQAPWLSGEDRLIGLGSMAFLWRHQRGTNWGAAWGSGSWLHRGLVGAFEGFRMGTDDAGIRPTACWRLAAARALREEGELCDWEEFFPLGWWEARRIGRVDVRIRFGGAERESKDTDVVAAQATAVALGVLTAADGGTEGLTRLIRALFDRGGLTDLDKTLGWKQGCVVAEVNRVMDGGKGE